MKTIKHLIISCLIIHFSASAMAKSLSNNQQAFISSVRSSVTQINKGILTDRARLTKNFNQWHGGKPVSPKEIAWLKKLAEQYNMKSFSTQSNKDWQELLARVDIIPESLALAQAINESAWGKSRFAEEGNNLFGRWCYTAGCGIVPRQRPRGRHYEVKRYRTRMASVRDYVQNINSNSAYQSLRSIRLALRGKRAHLDGMALANGLLHYSSRGKAYVADIQSIIKRYQLQST